MSFIYKYLKEKATDSKYQNKIYYTQDGWYAKLPYKNYTFKDLYRDVNNTIKYFKKNKITNKVCFLVVNSTYQDMVTFIAMLELGIKPIIVNSDMLYDLYKNKKDNSHVFPYEIISSVLIDDKHNISIPDNFVLDKDPFKNNEIIASKKDIENLLSNNLKVEEVEKLSNYAFAVYSSGTTGKGNLFPIKEDELINKIFKKHDLKKEETFVSQNPISSISGLLFSLYIPLVGRNKHVYVGNLILPNYKGVSDHLNIILPSRYLSTIGSRNKNMPMITDETGELIKKIDQITLLGDKVTTDALNLIFYSVPNLPIEKLFGYYGRTENLGLISKINRKDMAPLYLYYQEIYPNKLIYSLDKENVYEIEFINGETITKKSNITYQKNLFCEVLPVAIINREDEDIHINNHIFGEIVADGKNTNDYGFVFDNKIYYLCRRDELIFKDNNKCYYITALENILKEEAKGNFVYVAQDNNKKMNIYFPLDYDDKYSSSYYLYLDELNEVLSYIKNLDNIGDVHLVNRKDIEYGCEIGKLKRNKLLDFSSIYSPYDAQNKGYKNIISEIISKKLNREVILEEKDKYLIFPKNTFSDVDIARILPLFKVLDYKEDNNNRYLAIIDSFLFSKKAKQVIDKHEEIRYIASLRNNKLRDYLLQKNNLIDKKVVKLGFFHDDNNRFSVAISAFEVDLNKKIDNLSYFLHYDRLIEKEVTCYLELNEYEMSNIVKYAAVQKFSIDDENNFYVNDVKIEFNYLSSELYYMMYDLLIKNKFDKIDSIKKTKSLLK